MLRPDLCLEFVNTRYWRGRPAPTETLNTVEDLTAWAAANVKLRKEMLGQAEFERAIELRETIYRLFDATARDKPPAPRDLEAFNSALAAAPARRRLRKDRDGFSWTVEMKSSTAHDLLAPVLWSAGDLLAGTRLGRARLCANPQCRWLFLDDSRAGKRRWCSMQACGNRAKARRHYRKSRPQDRQD